MTRKEHVEQHMLLHHYLDELVADFITHEEGLPSKNTIMDLIQWSNNQCFNLDHEPGGTNG